MAAAERAAGKADLTYDVTLVVQGISGPVVAAVSGITATHWKPTVKLLPATTYTWRISGHSPCGNQVVSPWFTFTTR